MLCVLCTAVFLSFMKYILASILEYINEKAKKPSEKSFIIR